jgi:hypothetical protein
MRLLNLTGETFERLTVIGRGRDRSNRSAWLCRCICGKTKSITAHELRAGKSRSCGCLRTELRIARSTTHGRSNTVEGSAFYAAKNRCTNPKSGAWKDYGGRGIKFLYKDIPEFIADVGMRPSPEHSLDRIRVNGNYEPGNCRWATDAQQMLNRRISQVSEANLVEWFGEVEGTRIWTVIRQRTFAGEFDHGN